MLCDKTSRAISYFIVCTLNGMYLYKWRHCKIFVGRFIDAHYSFISNVDFRSEAVSKTSMRKSYNSLRLGVEI